MSTVLAALLMIATGSSVASAASEPASVEVFGDASQFAMVGTQFGRDLNFIVLDTGGQPVEGVTVIFSVWETGASATLSAGTATTNAVGMVSVSATANTVSGSYAVSARVEGLAVRADFFLTNLPGPVASVMAVSGTPQSATINTAFATPIAAKVADQYGNGVSRQVVTVVVPSSGASAVPAIIRDSTNSSGLFQTSIVANAVAGRYSAYIVLDSGGGGPSTITAMSGGSFAQFDLENLGLTTGTTLSSSANPGLIGQSITFTAHVSPLAATGTVTFRDGGATLGAGTVSNGVATFTTSSLASGVHTIVAAYSGDASYAPSSSSELPQTIIADGTVTLRVVSGDGDGTFAFSSTTAQLNTVVSTVGGLGQTAGISLNPGTYTVSISVPNGFGLAGVTCSDGDSTGDITSRAATIVLASAERVVCTFLSVNSRTKTVGVIANFLNRRNDLLLSNGPDGNRQINRLLNAGGGRSEVGGVASGGSRLGGPPHVGGAVGSVAETRFGGGSFEARLGDLRGDDGVSGDGQPRGVAPGTISGSTEGVKRMSFATSLSAMMSSSAEAERRKIEGLSGDGAMGLGASRKLPSARASSPLDIWFEGHFLSFSDDVDRFRLDSGGHFSVFYVGADYVVNRRVLIGALVQWDNMEQRSSAQAYAIEGHGWMAGPYATIRLADNVFLQARTAWGRSTNDVAPFLTYSDQFDTARWLTTGTLTGRWRYDRWEVRPSATLAYIEDVSEAYRDSLGVAIPSVKASLGQFKAGPEFSYRYSLAGGMVLEPRLGVQVIWNFSNTDRVADFGGTLNGPEDVRGRVEVGLKAQAKSGLAFDISGSYDGVGSEGFHSIGGKAMVRIPLAGE